MSRNARTHRYSATLICCVLVMWPAWKVTQIVYWPQWVQVKNSGSVAARNVKVEVWNSDGVLVATKQWSRLSPGWSIKLRHSHVDITAKVTFTLDYGTSSYHQRHPVCSAGEGWYYRIEGNGVVLSQGQDPDGSLMDRLFPRVY